jgi:hypothetical protein
MQKLISVSISVIYYLCFGTFIAYFSSDTVGFINVLHKHIKKKCRLLKFFFYQILILGTTYKFENVKAILKKTFS